jgi:hypothetical protein
MIDETIQAYHAAQTAEYRAICDVLASQIEAVLTEAECKIWHAHPVWFLDGNLTVGYSKLKSGIRLMFWSGADFEEPKLKPGSGKFKDASVLYTTADAVQQEELKRWLKKSLEIQWDYKNVVKRKGRLERLK